MTDSGHTSDRRTVLRTLAAGGAVAASGGLASAGSPPPHAAELARRDEAIQQFGDVDTVQRLFALHGRPIAESLADEGYLSTEPSVRSVVSLSEFADDPTSGVAAIGDGHVNGEHVIDVRVKQVTDSHEIEYHLHPGPESGYAEVTPLDGGTSVAVTDGGAVTDITTSSCCPSTTTADCDSNCRDYRCTDNYCDCDESAGMIFHDKEQKCCTVYEDGTGNEVCECQWEYYSCDCEEPTDKCP